MVHGLKALLAMASATEARSEFYRSPYGEPDPVASESAQRLQEIQPPDSDHKQQAEESQQDKAAMEDGEPAVKRRCV